MSLLYFRNVNLLFNIFEKLMTRTVNIFVLKKHLRILKQKSFLYPPTKFFCEKTKTKKYNFAIKAKRCIKLYFNLVVYRN